ncbi:MAG: zf-HC2 domain-containing protein [Nocardiopsaceae bacterium]|nr:zf-HC2 domain-containing protein [Nocardiopsaceae bacterium]
MNHLGRWITALVDGELDGTERDRVLNHVAGCDACRQEANSMRALKRRLIAFGQTSAEPPITGRLIELGQRDEWTVGPRFGAASWLAAFPDRAPGHKSRQNRPAWKIASGSATGAMLAIGIAAFLLGNASSAPPAPKITPSVDSYLLQHSFDAGQEPAGSAAANGATPTGGQPGSAQYWMSGQTPAGLDPYRPGHVEQLVPLAEQGGSAGGSGPSAGPVASAPASPSPATSASASPAASAATSPASPDSSANKQPASRSTK